MTTNYILSIQRTSIAAQDRHYRIRRGQVLRGQSQRRDDEAQA